MDPIRNPYTPGAGSQPPALAGRDAELAAFGVHLRRLLEGRSEKSVLITGLRGVGKTVLLGRFGEMAREAGFKTAQAEITHDTNFRKEVGRHVHRILLELDPIEKMRGKVRKAAGVLKAFTMKGPEGYEISIDVDALTGHADSGDLGEDLIDLFLAVGEAAQTKSTGAVLLLDEIQLLKRTDLEALIAAIHRVSQQVLPLTVAGAGLPQLPKLVGEAKSYAERLFNFTKIGRLNDEYARIALEEPAAKEHVEFEPAATALILKFTEGYPYFLQEYGRHVWTIAQGASITRKNAERAADLVRTHLDESFFEVRVSRATRSELRYLTAMAALGAGPHRSRDIGEKLGRGTSALSPTRDVLIDKGLIYSPTYGSIAFTVPQFDDYLRRHWPLERAE